MPRPRRTDSEIEASVMIAPEVLRRAARGARITRASWSDPEQRERREQAAVARRRHGAQLKSA